MVTWWFVGLVVWRDCYRAPLKSQKPTKAQTTILPLHSLKLTVQPLKKIRLIPKKEIHLNQPTNQPLPCFFLGRQTLFFVLFQGGVTLTDRHVNATRGKSAPDFEEAVVWWVLVGVVPGLAVLGGSGRVLKEKGFRQLAAPLFLFFVHTLPKTNT